MEDGIKWKVIHTGS